VPWGKRLSNVCKFVWLGHSNYNQLIFSQVSITLETSETINPRALHPSRRGSPTITKVPFYSFRIWFDFEPNLHDTASFCALYLNVLLEKNGEKCLRSPSRSNFRKTLLPLCMDFSISVVHCPCPICSSFYRNIHQFYLICFNCWPFSSFCTPWTAA
jgi:hypothetical protein